MALCAAAGLFAAVPAVAIAQVRAFNLPRQPLERALPAFAEQAGLQVIAPADPLRGRESPPIIGRVDVRQALRRLVAGAGLEIASDDGLVVVLRRTEGDMRPIPPPIATLDEIVVTALRYETIAQQTPLAISAASGEALAQRGATTVADLQGSTPGLHLTEVNTDQRRYSIRGVQSAGENTVGLYVGETPVTGPNSATSDPSSITPAVVLFDVDRVEVLRGPQGTLFGSGSMTGTVRVLFNDADLISREGLFEISAGLTEGGGASRSTRAMVNLPLIDHQLAARLVVYDEETAGYIDNLRLGREDVNSSRLRGGRLMGTYHAKPGLTLTGMISLQEQQARDSNVWSPAAGPLRTVNHARLPFPNTLNLYNLSTEWDIGPAVLNASASYYDWRATKYIDATFGALYAAETGAQCRRYTGIDTICGPADLAAYQAYIHSVLPLVGYQPMEVTSWVHEIRLASRMGGRLQWTLGAFYEDRGDTSQSSTVEVDAASGEPKRPLVYNFSRASAVDLRQTALFGEFSYRFADAWTLRMGARRYSYDKTSAAQVLISSYINASVAGPETVGRVEADGWVGRLNLSYEVRPGALIYVQYSQGFRPGGINNTPDLPANLIPYAPDSLDNYEFGLKSTWWDGRLVLNSALYQLRWSDMQIAARVPDFNFITNAGASTIRGLELEGSLRPMEGLLLSGAANLVDGRLDTDQTTVMISAPGLAGDRIPNEPRMTLSAGAQYDWRLDGLEAMLRLDYAYIGESRSTFRPDNPYFETMGDYGRLDLRASLDGVDWTAVLFLENLLNGDGEISAASRSEYERNTISLSPRRVGVELIKRF